MANYTVVQYVPDPVTDERVNVGVIVFDGPLVIAKFLRDWRRVKHFGQEDLVFLRDLERRVHEWSPPQWELPGMEQAVHLDEGGIREIAGRWMNSIQFTEPKASLLDPRNLLSEMAGRFLREPPRKRRGFRDRRVAAGIARGGLREALARRPKLADVKVESNVRILGKLDQHTLDAAVRNGRVIAAAHGLSFEGPITPELQKEIDATAWAIDDIRAADGSVVLGVVALPPKTKSKTYDRALHVFEGLKADVLDETGVVAWGERILVGALNG